MSQKVARQRLNVLELAEQLTNAEGAVVATKCIGQTSAIGSGPLIRASSPIHTGRPHRLGSTHAVRVKAFNRSRAATRCLARAAPADGAFRC